MADLKDYSEDDIERACLETSEQLCIPVDKVKIIVQKCMNKKINYVIGPNLLVELYNYKWNVWVYLFGEYHFIKNIHQRDDMMSIDKFLVKVVKDCKDIPIDLFFESPLNLGPIEPNFTTIGKDKSLAKIYKEFYDCLTINKDACPYPNIRAHNIDPRRYGLYGKLRTFIGNFDILVPKMTNPIILYDYSISILKQSTKTLEDCKNVVEVLYRFSDGQGKIAKQKQHTHPYVAKKLEPFIEKYVQGKLGKEWKSIITQRMSDVVDDLEKNKDRYISDARSLYNKIKEIVLFFTDHVLFSSLTKITNQSTRFMFLVFLCKPKYLQTTK